MKYVVNVGGEEFEVTVDGSTARLDGADAETHVADVDGTPVRIITLGNRVYRVVARRRSAAGQYTIDVGGFRFEVEALDERTRAIRHLAGGTARSTGPSALTAPMPGLVVRVLVGRGDRVQPGQGLVVIEAMKMENELRASGAAIVREVRVAAGTAVEKGALLVEFDPAP